MIRCEGCERLEVCIKVWAKAIGALSSKEEFDQLRYVFDQCAKK